MATGGAANIYGLLFQILQTLQWVLKIHLSANSDDGSITLVLEPQSGGDLQIAFPTHRLVQQYKMICVTRESPPVRVVDAVLSFGRPGSRNRDVNFREQRQFERRTDAFEGSRTAGMVAVLIERAENTSARSPLDALALR